MSFKERKLTLLKIKIFEKNITQEVLSQRSGVNRSDLSRISNGKFIPNSAQKKAIAQVLGVSVKELFADCPETWTQVAE